MERKSSSSIMKKLIKRESLPVLSFGRTISSKDKTRRKSEGMLSVPEHLVEQNKTPIWYLKEVKTRDAAEEILNNSKVGTFLVRDSETSKLPGCYTLSLLHKDKKLRHHKIETNPRNNKLVLKGYENHQFDDLEKLVDFFVKTQKKAINLIPYNPNGDDQEDGVDGSMHQPCPYEEMHGSQDQDEYQDMGDGTNDVVKEQIRRGYAGGQGPPPPLPTRKDSTSYQQSYENLIPQRDVPPAPVPSQQSYENIPSKGSSPLPPPPCPYNAPPLPPRTNNMNTNSYENIPERPPPHPKSYENYGGQSGYENYFKRTSQPQPSHGHSYQNLPPKVAPRKQVFHSAEQHLPPKPSVPLRRSRTDTAEDWKRKEY